MKSHRLVVPALALLCLAGCASSPTSGPNTPAGASAQPLAGQPNFASPEEAVAALYSASHNRDLKAMALVVGLHEQDIATDDPDKDAVQAERFAKAHDENLRIVRQGDDYARVFIGTDNYPLASALVRRDDRWFFDSAGGKDALLSRVIGENELATIGVCRAYVQAQYEYYAEDRNADDVLQYAQRLASNAGQHDGLYWPTAGSDRPSPLGSLIAKAQTEGFLTSNAGTLDEPKPYHGYLFKILTAQGEHAPGGKYSYVINGRMVAGFGLLASPAKWNHSAIMTFMVGANGKVYQKNLGESTARIAGEISEYDPDSTWTLVPD